MKSKLTLLLLFTYFTISSQNSIQTTFDKIKELSYLENASLSFHVMDVDSDSTVAEYQSKKSLVPASTMKLVTTSAALVTLGSYKQFKTKIEHDGVIDTNGVLHGNIIIKGGGDPTLGSKYFLEKEESPSDFMNTWVKEIQNFGIKEITGRVIGDASHFSYEMIPSTWLWGDMGNYYGAGPCGLSIYDNYSTLTFRSGSTAGDSTFIDCITPFSPDQRIENRVISSNQNKDNAYVYSSPYSNQRLIKGSIPKDREEFDVKASMMDPAFQTAYDMEYFLLKAGISVGENASTKRRLELKNQLISNERTTIYVHSSPSIGQIAYYTNHVSINLFAEHLLNEMGVAIFNDGSNYSGGMAVQNFWNSRIDSKGMYVSDGSGMSRMNAISARHLTSILDYMASSKNYSSFYSSLPIAGKSGTMSRIGRNTYAAGRLRAKSGTMTRVKSYAGYVTSKSGKNLAFAIIVNNYNCYTSTITKKLEQIMVEIANY